MNERSDYQKLRSHLAFLRMTAAAEALPALLDEATKARLSHSAFLEALLAVEVEFVNPKWPHRDGLIWPHDGVGSRW